MLCVASTDEVQVAVHELGGDGPTLLLAHATGLHGRCWEPVARHLREHRCVALDFRGHGDSSKPQPHEYRWEGFAEDVLAVIDALGLERPFGVGHSKGGAALLLAEEARPGTFSGLWCFDPVVFPPFLASAREQAGENPLARTAARRRGRFPSRDDALENFATKAPFDVVTTEALEAYVDHGFSTEPDGSLHIKCPPRVEAQVYRMGVAHGAFEGLGEVRCPVTIARARVEGMSPAAFAEQIAAALPAGRLEDHSELTHFGPLQDPERVARSIATAAARAVAAAPDG